MDSLLIGLLVSVIAQTGLLWYKMGKNEQRIENLVEQLRRLNNRH